MARKHYWQFLVTDEGNPIENAQISIFNAGTSDPVWIYFDELGADGTDTEPQVITSSKGYFEFWIADESENHGYQLNNKFKIHWLGSGVSEGYIDNVDVFSNFIEKVDITDQSELRNKAVSNKLAYDWEAHRGATFPTDDVHGILGIVLTETDDNVNKLVSNYNGFVWDGHARRMWDGTDDSTFLGGASPAFVHGIEPVDETTDVETGGNGVIATTSVFTETGFTGTSDAIEEIILPDTSGNGLTNATFTVTCDGGGGIVVTLLNGGKGYSLSDAIVLDATVLSGITVGTLNATVASLLLDKNKLVSNALAYSWTNHVTNVSGSIDHPQFSLIDGTRDFTAPVGYANGTIALSNGPNDFITQASIDNLGYSEQLTNTGWTDEGNGLYSKNVAHNLGENYPMVTVWNTTDSPAVVVQPESIKNIDDNNIEIWVSTNDVAYFIRIMT